MWCMVKAKSQNVSVIYTVLPSVMHDNAPDTISTSFIYWQGALCAKHNNFALHIQQGHNFVMQGWARSDFTRQYQYQHSIEGKCQAISKSILTWLPELLPKININDLDIVFQYWFNIKSHLNDMSKVNIKIKRWILSSQDQNNIKIEYEVPISISKPIFLTIFLNFSKFLTFFSHYDVIVT